LRLIIWESLTLANWEDGRTAKKYYENKAIKKEVYGHQGVR